MNATLFLSPYGRIARGTFWLGFLAVTVIGILINAIPVVGAVLGLMMLWPQIVIHVKRLHDIGWSGWLLLLPFGISAVCMTAMALTGGAALAIATPEEVPALAVTPAMRVPLIFFEIAFAVEIAFLLWVGLTKGQTDANRFGPAPR